MYSILTLRGKEMYLTIHILVTATEYFGIRTEIVFSVKVVIINKYKNGIKFYLHEYAFRRILQFVGEFITLVCGNLTYILKQNISCYIL